MRDRIIAIFLLIVAALTVWAIAAELPKKEYATPASEFSDAIREGTSTTFPAVSDEVIRLHILADSDSERDQAVKLALRDRLLPYLNAATLQATSKEEALTALEAHCQELTDIANAALQQFGCSYTARVSVETLYFPVRIYGSQTYLSKDAVIFPPGFYDSVQIVLGSGQGHNWWCLAYPSLCFIDSAYDYIPKDSDIYRMNIGTVEKSVLEELFFGQDIDNLLPEAASEDTEITICFGSKLWELLKSLFQNFTMQNSAPVLYCR